MKMKHLRVVLLTLVELVDTVSDGDDGPNKGSSLPVNWAGGVIGGLFDDLLTLHILKF